MRQHEYLEFEHVEIAELNRLGRDGWLGANDIVNSLGPPKDVSVFQRFEGLGGRPSKLRHVPEPEPNLPCSPAYAMFDVAPIKVLVTAADYEVSDDRV